MSELPWVLATVMAVLWALAQAKRLRMQELQLRNMKRINDGLAKMWQKSSEELAWLKCEREAADRRRDDD